MFATTKETYGHVDVLFANAGIAKPMPIADVDEAHFDQHFGINVKGLFFTVQKALPVLKDGGSIILTGSVVDRLCMAGMTVYSGTKGAVRTLARALSSSLSDATFVSTPSARVPLRPQSSAAWNCHRRWPTRWAARSSAESRPCVWQGGRDRERGLVPGVERRCVHHRRRHCGRRRHGATLIMSASWVRPCAH